MLKLIFVIALLAALLFLSFKGVKQIRHELSQRRKKAIEKAEAIEKTRIAEYERKLFSRLREDGFLHDPGYSGMLRNAHRATKWVPRDEFREHLRSLEERMETGRKQIKAQSERIGLLERQLKAGVVL